MAVEQIRDEDPDRSEIKSVPPVPERNKFPPDSYEWFDAEYKKIKGSPLESKFKINLSYASRKIRDDFVRNHPGFRP